MSAWRALAAAGLAGALSGGCTVGSGAGDATGKLMVLGCNEANSLQTLSDYGLKPSFFAGEPIEDICPAPGTCSGAHTNRLLIRMQHTGNRIEVNDTLYFDIQDALEVARCVRGQVKNGVPTWNQRFLTAPDGTLSNVPWCDWNAVAFTSADGGTADGGGLDAGVPDAGALDAGVPMTGMRARINLSTEDFVRASLMPLFTCNMARVVGVATIGSWIEFEYFGQALQPDVPADQRGDIVEDYKVEFGERLRARFHLILEDERVVFAEKVRAARPIPRVGGILDGFFDFDLDRGRAAQQFP